MRVPRHDERPEGQSAGDKRPAPSQFVPTEKLVEALAGTPKINFERFRADIYEFVDPAPRIWFED
jgi:hypothetical protein